MATKKTDNSCCAPGVPAVERLDCCRVEAVIAVDERGQMVLPKDIREKAGIRAGDKLALVSWEKEGKVYCMSLLKVEDMTVMVKNILGPLMGEILK